MEDAIMLNNGEDCVYLPPGFRFYPTDEEIITNYLLQKVTDPNFTAEAVGEVDLNKCEPWQLPSRAKMGEKEWYFFVQKDKKYPTGFRINRATASGYWKATGKDKEIHKGKKELVGMKKTLVFYKGRAPHGEKTNWVMHEFRLQGSSSKHQSHESQRSFQKIRMQDDWVVCKVFHKGIILGQGSHNMNSNACYFEVPEINYSNCSNPSMLSTSFNSLTPLPEQPSMLPQAPDVVNLIHMHNEEQLVQDANQWYYNAPSQQYDSRIFSSDGSMNIDSVDSHWNF